MTNVHMVPWAPIIDGTEDDPLRTAVTQALGTASVCWKDADGFRVFDPDTALWVADGLTGWIAKWHEVQQ